MKKKELNDIIIKLFYIIKSYIDINQYKVFLFGSRADNSFHDVSDIDIGILGSKEVPLYILSNIKEDADKIKTLYSIDIVDFFNVSDEFREMAFKKRIFINEQGLAE